LGGAAAGSLEDGFVAAQRGDYVAAMRLWRPLADHGNAEAQCNLGTIYADGRGVPQDYVLAHMWFNLAASGTADGQVRDRAVESRDHAAAMMTPAQIAE